jgi:hypothetical protein
MLPYPCTRLLSFSFSIKSDQSKAAGRPSQHDASAAADRGRRRRRRRRRRRCKEGEEGDVLTAIRQSVPA